MSVLLLARAWSHNDLQMIPIPKQFQLKVNLPRATPTLREISWALSWQAHGTLGSLGLELADIHWGGTLRESGV